MSNKGTQALLESDVSAIRAIVKDDVSFSVSTTDAEGVKRLTLSLDAIVPTIVDIPFKRADILSKRLEIARNKFQYKVLVVGCLIYMFIQTMLSLLSVIFIKMRLKPFYRSGVLKRMKNCDLVISCSDENFREAASLLPSNIYWITTWWSILFERTLEISIAKFLGKPIVMFPNSIGPFRTCVGRFLSRLSLNNCNCILIRDPISYETVESLEIRSRKVLTSDTALLFKSKKENVAKNLSRPMIGVCPGIYSHSLLAKEVKNYVKEHALALDMAIEKYEFNVVFLPHYVSGFEYDDFEISKLILQTMKNKDRAKIINVNTAAEFKSLLEIMDMLISSKMHPAVLGASGYVPTLCIAYDHKQIGFFRHLDMIDYVIRIQKASHEGMFLKIGSIWKEREKIRRLLRKRIPKLQEDVRKALKKAISPFVKV